MADRTPNLIFKVIPTPNKVANQLQCIIKWHQDHLISLRSIALLPRLYDSYWNFCNKSEIKRTGEPIDKDVRLTLHDVDIVRGASFQKDEFYMERYRMDKGMSDVYFGPNHKMPDLKVYKR